jgi:putative bacteriocin precursor
MKKKLGKKKQTAQATIEAYDCGAKCASGANCPHPSQTAWYISLMQSGQINM